LTTQLLTALILFASSCNYNPPSKKIEPPTQSEISSGLGISLPDGFNISLYAEDIENARSMCYSPEGTLYVGTRGLGTVYALRDTDGDNKVDEKYVLMEDANMPNGVAYRDGDLYVAEVSRVVKFSDIENNLSNPPTPEVVYDSYPTEEHHGWKYIAFGPDGKLYVPVGAPCNICESEDAVFNSITRLDVDSKEMEIVHRGVRNTVGFTWHPKTDKLWFTDNGRDWMGDDMPACELNMADNDNLHFGYPYCHQGNLLDDEFGSNRNCNEFVPPVQNLGAHVAPLGVEFYTGDMFPEKYKNKVAFIAEHGSWNRSSKVGYRISMVTLDDDYNAVDYSVFAEGWLDKEKDEAWGRPVDIEYLPDGSMLVSDDFGDAIYRISYN
jgi:glucose/arabinose dehydrogenase